MNKLAIWGQLLANVGGLIMLLAGLAAFGFFVWFIAF